MEEGRDPDESFSGHMAWLNDLQVGLHLMAAGGLVKGLLRLQNSKNQVAPEQPDMSLILSQNGTTIVPYRSERASAVITLYHQLPVEMKKTERVGVISQQLGCSERSVWTYLSWLPDASQPQLLQD